MIFDTSQLAAECFIHDDHLCRRFPVEHEQDAYRYFLTRVAFTPPGILNRRHSPLQSQPQALQYHSLMPSHSSRSAIIALPSSMSFCIAGLGMPWTMGITSIEPHSGHARVFLRSELLLRVCFSAMRGAY